MQYRRRRRPGPDQRRTGASLDRGCRGSLACDQFCLHGAGTPQERGRLVVEYSHSRLLLRSCPANQSASTESEQYAAKHSDGLDRQKSTSDTEFKGVLDMHKITSALVGVSLSALALTGCAATSAEGLEPAAAVNVERGLSPAAASLAPDDSSVLGDDFWEVNQAPLGTATAAIEEQFPDDFAYAFFDDASAMHVGFKGVAPSEAVALLAATGLPHLTIDGVGFNAAEYQAAAESVSDQLREYVTDDRQVSVSQNSELAPGALKVSFLSEESRLTSDPGLADSVRVDEPFKVIFDSTNTSPIN